MSELPGDNSNPVDDDRLYLNIGDWMTAMQEEPKQRPEGDTRKNQRFFSDKNEDIYYSDLYFLMKRFYENLLKYAPEYTNFKTFGNKTNKINQWCKYTLQSRTSCKNNNKIARIPCSDIKKWINSYKNDHPDTDHYYYVV